MSAESKPVARGELRNELEVLSREAQRYIRAKRRRAAAIRSFRSALPWLILVPAAWLALRLVFSLSGAEIDRLPDWWVVATTLMLPGAIVLLAVIVSTLAVVDRRDALAALDKELGLEDRLVTAEEFLGNKQRSPFIEAALQDAARVAPAARAAVLHLERERFSLGRLELTTFAASLLLILLGGLVGGRPRSTTSTTASNTPLSDEVAALDIAEEDMTARPESELRDEQVEPELTLTAPATAEKSAARRDKAAEISDETKESEGKTGEGRSSDAESTSGASESRGMPSNQSQQSTPGEKPKPKETKKQAKPPSDLQPTEKKNAEENSGSTAGKGSSKGSNKNPAVSKWSSKDQVTTQDDQEIEEDEETEDEEEDQESRGGMQPNLRDRKPPVSRDLRIGFGNQKNPDANGRGGPSEAKKSRGTASLVLGVPIPDRVKGQPNPGKTKITQERIEPKAEESTAIDAQARRPRSAPAGNVQERELTPWMRAMVREYFLTLRNKNRRS